MTTCIPISDACPHIGLPCIPTNAHFLTWQSNKKQRRCFCSLLVVANQVKFVDSPAETHTPQSIHTIFHHIHLRSRSNAMIET
ncbi:hypothetical protein I7I48_06818 [Histoplasma ohiense]|nr:hypothetical protein I7I48_06818 [Histoplasma ohiense (nom. inval.)]